jgi:repressor LexA
MALTKKQKDVLDFIEGYFDKNGLAPTQKEIKEHFNLKSYGSVQRYLKYLMEEGLLESNWNERRGLKIKKPVEEFQDSREIPLLGDVAAGVAIEAIENPNTIQVPLHMVRKENRYFALQVRGDSMIEDGILEDDVLVVKQQENANQGQTVVAIIDGEATVKHYFKKSHCIELHPANSSMEPFIIDPTQNFKIAGVVVGLLRSYE